MGKIVVHNHKAHSLIAHCLIAWQNCGAESRGKIMDKLQSIIAIPGKNIGRIVEQNHRVELRGRIIDQIKGYNCMTKLQGGFTLCNHMGELCVESQGRINWQNHWANHRDNSMAKLQGGTKGQNRRA